LALARYSTAGVPDASFGSGGRVTIPSGSAIAMVVQGDGRIVVVKFGDSNTFTVVRYLGQ